MCLQLSGTTEFESLDGEAILLKSPRTSIECKQRYYYDNLKWKRKH